MEPPEPINRERTLAQSLELERYRAKLWRKYMSNSAANKQKAPFIVFFYDFLYRHFIQGHAIDVAYEHTCRDIQETLKYQAKVSSDSEQ